MPRSDVNVAGVRAIEQVLVNFAAQLRFLYVYLTCPSQNFDFLIRTPYWGHPACVSVVNSELLRLSNVGLNILLPVSLLEITRCDPLSIALPALHVHRAT